MNTKSLRFRLVSWYAGLLALAFVALGVAGYAALSSYLTGALKSSLARRARMIGQLAAANSRDKSLDTIGSEVEARYAPSANDRFVRVSRPDGNVLYASDTPASMSFMVTQLPGPSWPSRNSESRRIDLKEGRELLLYSTKVQDAKGAWLLIETGAPMDDVESDLSQWLRFLLAGIPVVILISALGGYLLVGKALRPVATIADSAEEISSHNLSERLPVPGTGDEIEKLSVALNHMIERLEEAFKNSRRFMADASHELRTPLTVLRGEVESFVQDPALPLEWKERLGSALEEIERLVKIVEALFAISRLDAGEAQAEFVRFDLARLVAGTAEQMSLLAEDKHIEVVCNAEPNVWVQGDRARMKQVVVNLLDNAIKYTPPEGKITLTVRGNGRAVLEVADSGIGIPEQALTQVFDRFFRVDEARSRDDGGAGLGLSIVKSICVAHNGHVEARSSPGQGSVFKVDLPLATANGKHSI